MAKVSKSLLKEIVKECLVEILAEGLTGGDVKTLKENVENVSYAHNRNIQKMLPPKNTKKVTNKKFKENTKKAISAATKDPVMASLLADTAKTTLQEQNQADGPANFAGKPTDNASKIVSESDPSELFGESSNNWAHLAFGNQ